MQKHPRSTEFASYVRNYTASAVRLTIPFGTLETAPKLSADEYSQLIARNRERHAVEPPAAQTAARAQQPPQPSNSDSIVESDAAAKEW
jgi:hypothetical protein